jgi:hypothetical protein
MAKIGKKFPLAVLSKDGHDPIGNRWDLTSSDGLPKSHPPKIASTLQKRHIFETYTFVLFLMYSISPMVLPLQSLFSRQLKRIFLAFIHVHVYV